MFSVAQKQALSDGIQKLLRETNHPELPTGEILFHIHVKGAEGWSWADIVNNRAVPNPSVNPHNEAQDAAPLAVIPAVKVAHAATLLSAADKVCELQDKLLVCYRIQRNPGSILDKLRTAKDAYQSLKGKADGK